MADKDTVVVPGEEQIRKGLQVLEQLAKGHSSKGTPSTEVASMSGQGGPSQLFHTPSNSDPGSWAGSTARDVPENGATDSISSNGTDYEQQAKMAKSIMEKIEKGVPLTSFEKTFFKGMMAEATEKGMPPFAKKDDKGGKEEEVEKGAAADADDEEVEKSFVDHAQENDVVQKGLEVSEFLANWADVTHKSLASMESRIIGEVRRMLAATAENSGEFNKSLAAAVTALGQGVALQGQALKQIESTPARGPKSVPAMHVIEKSLAGATGGENNPLENISKSQALDTMVRMVEAGQIAPQDVVRFESTGIISPEVAQRVAAAVAR